MMDCRRDLLPEFETPQNPDIQIEECNIEARMFIRKPSTRSLLPSCAGCVKGKYAKEIEPINETLL